MDFVDFLLRVYFTLWFSWFGVHLSKLCSDLQRCPILGLGDIEPHIQPTDDAEAQEYQKTKVIQFLLGMKHLRGHVFISVSLFTFI